MPVGNVVGEECKPGLACAKSEWSYALVTNVLTIMDRDRRVAIEPHGRMQSPSIKTHVYAENTNELRPSHLEGHQQADDAD